MTGKQLREIRARFGLAQAELARWLGVHGNTVARWERGEVGISEPAARLACVIFVKAERAAAMGREVTRELGGRIAGSTDRDRVRGAGRRAERRAIKWLEKLLGHRALAWWEGDDGKA